MTLIKWSYLLKELYSSTANKEVRTKKVHVIHVVVPEDKKTQARKALKEIYPSRPHNNYPEGIQWRVIENITDRNFTVTEQSSIVAERMKFKQSAFLQDLCTTEYKHLQNVNADVDIEPSKKSNFVSYIIRNENIEINSNEREYEKC